MNASSALLGALEASGLSQSDAARKAGVSPQLVSRILTKTDCQPHRSTIGKLKRGVPGFAERYDAAA